MDWLQKCFSCCPWYFRSRNFRTSYKIRSFKSFYFDNFIMEILNYTSPKYTYSENLQVFTKSLLTDGIAHDTILGYAVSEIAGLQLLSWQEKQRYVRQSRQHRLSILVTADNLATSYSITELLPRGTNLFWRAPGPGNVFLMSRPFQIILKSKITDCMYNILVKMFVIILSIKKAVCTTSMIIVMIRRSKQL